MDKKGLIQFCRYYKGEEDNPYNHDSDDSYLWDYERKWIDFNFSEDGRQILSSLMNDFVNVELTLFEMHDDTPVTLKALLFNRYAKGFMSMQEAVEPFKKFYKKVYYK